MRPWKTRAVVFAAALLSLSLSIFLVTGCAALYWAWLRADLQRALPFLPWARSFGMLGMASAAAALGMVSASKVFPLSPKTRLGLSLLSALMIASFAEFRNEGKFHLKNLVHFFGPGTWIHGALNQLVSSLGDSLYRIEYSHWNDFLMGPAIVSVLFPLAFLKVYGAVRNPAPLTLSTAPPRPSEDIDHALRFARTLMNVGLFWLFIQAWAEKAGYLINPHSNDEIDLPVEFAGTVLGFWMVRALTRPFDKPPERYRSTFLTDFLSAGLIGLLYTLIVGWLTEGVARAVAHGLYPVVPASLEVHEYTPVQRHMRPFELLLLAAAMWWGLNRSSRPEGITQLGNAGEVPAPASKWDVPIALAKALGATVGYLLIVVAMLSFLEPQGIGETLATAGAGIGLGTAAFLLARRLGQRRLTTVLGRDDDTSDPEPPTTAS